MNDFETRLSLAIAWVIEEAGTTPYTVGDIKDCIRPIIAEQTTAEIIAELERLAKKNKVVTFHEDMGTGFAVPHKELIKAIEELKAKETQL